MIPRTLQYKSSILSSLSKGDVVVITINIVIHIKDEIKNEYSSNLDNNVG